MNLLLLPLLAAVAAPASAQTLPVYKCPAVGTQRTFVDYSGSSFQLNLSPDTSRYLQPNMDCGIYIVGYQNRRWVITMDNVSLAAYGATFVLEDGSIGGTQLIKVTRAGTPFRQLVTPSGSFNARLVTASGPTATALGVNLTVELLNTGSCPSGWYRMNGFCYGSPKLAASVNFSSAIKGCNLMMANLAMGNFEYDSISSPLAQAPASVVSLIVAYWVGIYSSGDATRFLNAYNSLDSPINALCSISSSNCNCVAYMNGRFYRDDCASSRPYICSMPLGGTSSYYDLSSLLSTTTSMISVVAIVLIVLFVVAMAISIIVGLVCCLRRSAAHRRQLRRQQAAGAILASVNSGYPRQHQPPPPPPPPPAAAAPSYQPPPYPQEHVYNNAGFNPSAEPMDKPPSYENVGWTGQRVAP